MYDINKKSNSLHVLILYVWSQNWLQKAANTESFTNSPTCAFQELLRDDKASEAQRRKHRLMKRRIVEAAHRGTFKGKGKGIIWKVRSNFVIQPRASASLCATVSKQHGVGSSENIRFDPLMARCLRSSAPELSSAPHSGFTKKMINNNCPSR